MKNIIVIFLFIVPFIFISCGNDYTPEEEEYIEKIQKDREEKNEFMKNDPSSPFNQDENAEFDELKYFDIKPDMKFESKLYEYVYKDTIKISGTKGEERKVVRYGYLFIQPDSVEYKINVYKGWTNNGDEYYSIWFTDETTGNETYGVGRYLDFELDDDKDHIYTVDFNKAYNPYCAYSSKYSCAIPTKEDHLNFPILAGEKKFHQ